MTNAIITMQLITVTNGDRFCHSFVYDNQSTWKNFDSFSSEHKSIRSKHKSIRSQHKSIRSEHKSIRSQHKSICSEHKSIRSEHKSIRSLGQWFGIEVWQRQPAI